MSDSLLAPLDTLLAKFPREPLYHVVHLRTFQILRRPDALRAAFERWVRDDPSSPAPYGEYARVLIQLGRPASADSVIEQAKSRLGSTRDLQYETAQLRAAMGDWEPSASAWRRALTTDPHLSSAAAYALAPAPVGVRPAIRRILSMNPPERGARRALADLEITWGQPQASWEALRGLPPDTASASAWEDFGDRAMTEERFALAREAFSAAVRVQRTPALALKAARASLRAGSPADVFSLAPMSELASDPARVAREYLPVHVEALAALGRGGQAEALVAKYDRYLPPGQHARMARLLASAWVRAGDLARAREALRSAGADADSSDAAGLDRIVRGPARRGAQAAARLAGSERRHGAGPGHHLTRARRRGPATGRGVPRARTGRQRGVRAAFRRGGGAASRSSAGAAAHWRAHARGAERFEGRDRRLAADRRAARQCARSSRGGAGVGARSASQWRHRGRRSRTWST